MRIKDENLVSLFRIYHQKMETKDIIILVLCLVVAGYSLYRKYMKKNAEGTSRNQTSDSSSQFSSKSKDDDYEPYADKKK